MNLKSLLILAAVSILGVAVFAQSDPTPAPSSPTCPCKSECKTADKPCATEKCATEKCAVDKPMGMKCKGMGMGCKMKMTPAAN